MRHYIDWNDESTLPPAETEIVVWHRLYGRIVEETKQNAVMRRNWLNKALFFAKDMDGYFTQRISDVFAWEEKTDEQRNERQD